MLMRTSMSESTSIFLHHVLDEPQLEFGQGALDIDVRFGLMRHGPLEPDRAREVRIAVIGTSETTEGFEQWIDQCSAGIAAKPSKQQNLFVRFPGLNEDNPFRCSFSVDQGAVRELPRRDIEKLIKIANADDAVLAAVELFQNEVTVLAEASVRPDVIVCALPANLIQKIVNESGEERAKRGRGVRRARRAGIRDVDFRDMLKAKTIQLGIPLQLVWPTTWSDDAKIGRVLKKHSQRTVQDPATRAWNFFTAVYYKAGYVPWRMPRDPTAFRSSFVGISFYEDPLANRLLTSTAQMFDERGQGFIIRGGRAQTDKDDRRVFLARTDAYTLLRRSLEAYRSQHKQYPARVVLHKTSRFEQTELEGFREALDETRVELGDFVWISSSSPLRVFRPGGYPVLRGTCITYEKEALLYTRGSVPFFQTYPGMFIPTPVAMRCSHSESTALDVAREVLLLSKMNWNTSQFDGGLPITLRAAREVSRVLRYVPGTVRDVPQYSFYM
jgi:hypothetical protein